MIASKTPLGGHVKRALDIVLCLAALVLLAPLITAALLARSLFGKPLIAAETRIGFGGKQFLCYRFTTQVAGYKPGDAGSNMSRSSGTSLDKIPTGGSGEFLEQSWLTNVPRLINVIRGEMSLIGPKPITIAELEAFGEYTLEYLVARPGVIGLWSSPPEHETSTDERIQLDIEYVHTWSVRNDLSILFRVLLTALTGFLHPKSN